MIRLEKGPIDVAELLAAVADPEHGGTTIFIGTTRREGAARAVGALEFEAYEQLAASEMATVAEEVGRRHGAKVAMAHRLGAVPAGEATVAVAASSRGREEAFSAAREGIDELKARVPIWKRSDYEDGGVEWSRAAESADASPTPTPPHLDEGGRAQMVDVGGKPAVRRVARARARLRMSPEAAGAILAGRVPKGDVAAVARVAGIQAAKRTPELIALCHPLPIDRTTLAIDVDPTGEAAVTAEVAVTARTGVEMEALTAASVAALNVWDMVKGIDPDLVITEVVLLEKRKDVHGSDGSA